jgi:hypothetical protein
MNEAILLEWVTLAVVAALAFALGWYASGRRRRQSGG